MQKKIAVITGASSGIGQAVALDFAKQGYHLVLLARSEDKLKNIQTDIERSQGSAVYYALDVTDAKRVEKVLEEVINQYKQIDVLLNNAGIFRFGTSDIDVADIDSMMKTNLLGAIYVGNVVARQMKKQKSGYIFNLASIAGKRVFSTNGLYCSTKFGFVGYGEALFKELSPYGVKVTNICPGLVATNMTKDMALAASLMIQPEDIVKTMRYLLSLGKTATVHEVIIQCVDSVNKEVEMDKKRFTDDN